jgi:MFS family permease
MTRQRVSPPGAEAGELSPDQEPVRPRRMFYGWYVVITLGVISVVVQGTSSYLFGVVLVQLQHDLGSSRAAISGAFSLSFVIWGLAGIPAGRFVDRRGARALMTIGALLGGVSLLAMAAATSLWEIYLFWGLGVGIAVGLTSQQLGYAVAAAWFDRRIGSAFGIVTTLSALAPTLYLPAIGLVSARVGWRPAVLVGGLLYLLVALPAAIVIRRRPADLGLRLDGLANPIGPTLISSGLSLGEALRTIAFWTITLNATFALVSWAAVSAHQIAFLIGRGIDPVVAASALGVVGLVSIPARLIVNVLSDRLGPRLLLGLTMAIQALGTLLLLLTTNLFWLSAYVVIFGLAFGAASGLRAAMMAEHIGRRRFGAITAVMALASVAPSALGPVVAGWLYDRAHNYDLAFGLATLCMVMATVMVLVTPTSATERLRRQAVAT